MISLLIALGIFYLIGWEFTSNPWLTVLKIWLWGWLVCATVNFFWLLKEQRRVRNSDTSGKNPFSVGAIPAIVIVNAFLSLFMTAYWPALVVDLFQEKLTKLAIRLGLRTEPPPEREPLLKADKKAVQDTENSWQLEGESCLAAITIPNPPVLGTATTVRLTHSNAYGPCDDVDFFVRIGNPCKPTGEKDLDSSADWIKAKLVEEIVSIDGDEMLRSEAKEPFKDETPWDGTYEAQLTIPSGKQLIEIKIISRCPELIASRVLAGWDVTAM